VHFSNDPSSGDPEHVDRNARAEALLRASTAELGDLVLDPGDELTVADDPSVAADASFMRAFVPMRSYKRLCGTGLDGLISSIARNPAQLAGRILVRELTPDEPGGQYVVLDGSRHVAAMRQLAEAGSANGVGLSSDVTRLFVACPITVVHPATDPAFVLALLADATEPGADPWLQGQRNRLLRQLATGGVHHSQATLAAAAAGNPQILRRYHAYRGLQQMMHHETVPLHVATVLYPLFHAALGRSVIRTWLDWDDTLCCSMDDVELDHFHRLLRPSVRPDGTTRPPCLRAIDDVGLLCDVLGEPAARNVLLGQGGTLVEAEAVINAGAFQQWSAQVGEAYETMRWDRRRFGPRT